MKNVNGIYNTIFCSTKVAEKLESKWYSRVSYQLIVKMAQLIFGGCSYISDLQLIPATFNSKPCKIRPAVFLSINPHRLWTFGTNSKIVFSLFDM